ncbi:OsmC family protein [Patulibacter sp.]|uniref:OsmC family protein n=1 Tax=Patulibacter sp. TaxID=1912859 RepID=UPI0027226BFF|nr:OsmC family protein [Patulibacter sp.]MDO9408931.1 OsmC family protein [Patulibacter sp.]
MATTKKQIVPFTVAGEGTGVLQRITVGGDGTAHRFATDTVPPFGGQDSEPSPLSLTLGALTGCNQITAQIVAKELGVTLGELRFDATGDFDPSVMAGGADGNANFDAVRVSATIATDADDATFERLKTETERRCPVTQLFVRSGLEFTSDWTNAAL